MSQAPVQEEYIENPEDSAFRIIDGAAGLFWSRLRSQVIGQDPSHKAVMGNTPMYPSLLSLQQAQSLDFDGPQPFEWLTRFVVLLNELECPSDMGWCALLNSEQYKDFAEQFAIEALRDTNFPEEMKTAFADDDNKIIADILQFGWPWNREEE
jgi:hypothetical protein